MPPANRFALLVIRVGLALRDVHIAPSHHSLQLVPLVQELHAEGDCCAALHPKVEVALEEPLKKQSPLLARAAARAQGQLRALWSGQAQRPGGQRWQVLRVSVELAEGAGADDNLRLESSWNYTLACQPGGARPEDPSAPSLGTCLIRAGGVFGAVSALQSTLPQLFARGGEAPFQSVRIRDWPDYPLRGIMVDTGRRFVPMDALKKEVINGMALVRMNFLHLHLSDFCRFAINLPGFPELNKSLEAPMMEGQYSVDDVREIVRFANDRGIIVMPEVDIPGHINGLLPLKAQGMEFCERSLESRPPPDRATKLLDDPSGRSRKVLRRLVREMAAAFGPELRVLHLGGDEVLPHGNCTEDSTVRLEGFAVGDVARKELGLTAVGWEELRLKAKEEDGVRSVGGGTDVILMAWQSQRAGAEVLRKGHRLIASFLPRHYLDFSYNTHKVTDFWYDVGREAGTPAQGVLGGISPMWTDMYCYMYQCGAAYRADQAGKRWQPPDRASGHDRWPSAGTMFHRDYDASFQMSLAGMIWPRAALTAAAFWNYQPGVTQTEVQALADLAARLLRSTAGVASCPPGCSCEETGACGKPYPVLESCGPGPGPCGAAASPSALPKLRACFWESAAAAAEQGVQVEEAMGGLASAEDEEEQQRLRREHDLDDALLLCFWMGERCLGVDCGAGPGRCRALGPAEATRRIALRKRPGGALAGSEGAVPGGLWAKDAGLEGCLLGSASGRAEAPRQARADAQGAAAPAPAAPAAPAKAAKTAKAATAAKAAKAATAAKTVQAAASWAAKSS